MCFTFYLVFTCTICFSAHSETRKQKDSAEYLLSQNVHGVYHLVPNMVDLVFTRALLVVSKCYKPKSKKGKLESSSN